MAAVEEVVQLAASQASRLVAVAVAAKVLHVHSPLGYKKRLAAKVTAVSSDPNQW